MQKNAVIQTSEARQKGHTSSVKTSKPISISLTGETNNGKNARPRPMKNCMGMVRSPSRY